MPTEALRTLSPTSGRDYALLDTNLLILEVSARVGPHVLGSFRRISTDFTAKDVRLLLAILSRFKAARTTAYVLAEASNLASGLTGSLRNAWFGELAQFALTTEEAHVSTKVIGSQAEFTRFGVADTALAYLARTHGGLF